MSFDMGLSAWKRGEPAFFDRRIVENAFAALIGEREEDLWKLKPAGEAVYTGAYSAEIRIAPDPEISAMSIHRPARDPEFWDALFLVLRETSAVLSWPALGRCACVATPAAIAGMPRDMLESVGIPAVVASGADIARCVRFGADFFEDGINGHPAPQADD